MNKRTRKKHSDRVRVTAQSKVPLDVHRGFPKALHQPLERSGYHLTLHRERSQKTGKNVHHWFTHTSKTSQKDYEKEKGMHPADIHHREKKRKGKGKTAKRGTQKEANEIRADQARKRSKPQVAPGRTPADHRAAAAKVKARHEDEPSSDELFNRRREKVKKYMHMKEGGLHRHTISN